MNKNALFASSLLLCFVLGNPAVAQEFEHRDGGGEYRHEPGPQKESRFQRAEAPHGYRYAEEREGAGPEHGFHRGERLSNEYRHPSYVVDDWRGHHLTPPPRGYRWVQVGADYALIAVTTGIIADILLSH